MISENLVIGDLVELNDESKKAGLHFKDTKPWAVLRITRDGEAAAIQRESQKTGKTYTMYIAVAWLKKVGHTELLVSPLDQFKLDCHDILKRLDCYGDESEVAYFVGALRAYEKAKAALNVKDLK